MMGGPMTQGAVLVLWALWAPAQGDPELERLREKQAEVRSLLAEAERAVELLRTRLGDRDPEAAARLNEVWEALRRQVVQEDMAEVERRLAAGNRRSAVRLIDEIIAKLEEILRKLLGGADETKEETPRLAEIRQQLHELLNQHKEGMRELQAIRDKADGGAAELSDRIGDLLKEQKRLQKETAGTPEASLLDAIRGLLEKVVRAREAQESLSAAARSGGEDPSALAGRQSKLRGETESIDGPMAEALELVHNHSGSLAHQLTAARDHVKAAAALMGEAEAAFSSGEAARAEPKQSGAETELRTAENLLREIVESLKARLEKLPELAGAQKDLENRIRNAADDADRIADRMENPEAAKDLKEAANALQRAEGHSQQASGALQQGNPSAAGPSQQSSADELAKARDAAAKASQAAQSKLPSDAEKGLGEVKAKQEELANKAGELAKQLGNNSAGQNLQGASGDMNQAAGKMGGSQQQQGGNPSQGGGNPQQQQGGSSPRDLKGAGEDQSKAERKIEDALKDVKQQERGQMLGELEGRLTYMIEEQKKINATTTDLDEKKRKMGELTRTERMEILLPAGAQQAKLADLAIECKGIAEGSDAPEIGWWFGAVSREMREVSSLLNENYTGSLTQRKERYILETLESLLKAVREKKNQQGGQSPSGEGQPQSGGENPPQDGGPQEQPPQEPSANNEPLGVEAEVRLLIELQRHLKVQTLEMGKMNGGSEELNRIHREIMGEIRGRQADVVDRLGRVISRVQGTQE